MAGIQCHKIGGKQYMLLLWQDAVFSMYNFTHNSFKGVLVQHVISTVHTRYSYASIVFLRLTGLFIKSL